MMLAIFGAEVIKVEEPGKGDYARNGQPRIHGLGASFALLNRGKKSIAINLKDPRGKEVFPATGGNGGCFNRRLPPPE